MNRKIIVLYSRFKVPCEVRALARHTIDLNCIYVLCCGCSLLRATSRLIIWILRVYIFVRLYILITPFPIRTHTHTHTPRVFGTETDFRAIQCGNCTTDGHSIFYYLQIFPFSPCLLLKLEISICARHRVMFSAAPLFDRLRPHRNNRYTKAN